MSGAVKAVMRRTIYYSHYLIVMTQMMVGNYWVQMLPSDPAHVITIKDGLVRGERLHAEVSRSKTQTPPARQQSFYPRTHHPSPSPQTSLFMNILYKMRLVQTCSMHKLQVMTICCPWIDHKGYCSIPTLPTKPQFSRSDDKTRV